MTEKETKKWTMASYLDRRMEAGVTWAQLRKGASVQVAKRGLKGPQTISDLKSHARSRLRQGHKVTMDDKKVLMVRAS